MPSQDKVVHIWYSYLLKLIHGAGSGITAGHTPSDQGVIQSSAFQVRKPEL